MISTTHNGSPAWLLWFEPTWSSPVTLRASVPSDVTRSLTGREARRARGASIRLELSWRAMLDSEQLSQLRDALAQYADEPVLVPLWPFATEGAAWPGPVTAGAAIGWNYGWSSWIAGPVSPSGWDYVATLLVGRVSVELPSLKAPGLAEVTFRFQEDSSAADGVTPEAVSWTAGPALNDSTAPPVFPLPVSWGEPVRSVGPSLDIVRRTIGRAPRLRAGAFYPASAAIPVEGTVKLTSQSQAATLLRWWLDRAGESGSHFVTTGAHAVDVAATAPAGATAIVVEDASKLGSYRFFSIDDGVRVQFVRVLSIASNTLTLQAPLGYAVSAGSALFSVAILARHAAEDVELDFAHPGFASARVTWEEVPDEYVVASGETRGTTLGAGPIRAWLYKITVDRLGTLTVYRRTSYERDLTVGADTWTAAPISHSSIEHSIRLDRDEVTIEGRAESWASVFLPGNLTARVTVEISECDVSGSTGSNVATRWIGEIARVSFDGPFVSASCSGPYSVFDRQVPRVTLQPGCNHAVYDSGCGLSAGDWTFSAAVNASVSGRVVTLKSFSRTLGLPTGWGFVNFFALGYLSRATERWLVLSSSAVSGGLVTLTLDRVSTWTADEAVTVVPGCDGRSETCRAYNASTNPEGKFSNFAKFLGFPYSPPKNPSFSIPKRSDSAYGKK